MQLAKSFEFACLNAKGEFIIPLGSDDGIMPYTLTEINKIMENIQKKILYSGKEGFMHGRDLMMVSKMSSLFHENIINLNTKQNMFQLNT